MIIMAEKKALLILAEGTALNAEAPATARLLKKGAFFPNYTQGTVLNGAIAPEAVQKVEASAVAGLVEAGTAFMLLEAATPEALETTLEACLEGIDRKTTLAVVAKNGVVFYGLGVNAKAGTVSRAVTAADILPTLAFTADIPLTEECCGAIVYQALKSPNLKLEEIAKLKEALVRMEGALARDNREPWDKHDCA